MNYIKVPWRIYRRLQTEARFVDMPRFGVGVGLILRKPGWYSLSLYPASFLPWNRSPVRKDGTRPN